MIVDNRNCLYCGAVLSGRSDKKYCDDNCRNNHHYQLRKDDDNSCVKFVNAALMRNRDILKSLRFNTGCVVKVKDLVNLNFNFELMTGIYKTRKGTEYKLIYDYAYRFVTENEVQLLKYC